MFLLFLIALVTTLQPQYEKVARLFNGANAVHPGLILMMRVDCAEKVLLLCFLDSSFFRERLYKVINIFLLSLALSEELLVFHHL